MPYCNLKIKLGYNNSITEWCAVFAALPFKLVYGMDVICRRLLGPKSCFSLDKTLSTL